jgi:hypothetical protein
MGITLVPSFGRDYKSGKEVQAAWDAGKDFTIQSIGHPDDGRQINKEDAEKIGGTFNIRYKQSRNIKVIKVTKKAA